jgi:hypothetical protein
MRSNYYPVCSAIILTALLVTALSFSVHAIEKPIAPSRDNGGQSSTLNQAHNDFLGDAAAAKEANIAWVGLGGAPVSETLAKHLGLEEGVGLTIHHVLNGAPADKIGIKQHDVLVEFDGKKIGSFEALRDAVRARKPGDEVEVAFVQGGNLQKKKVTLAERKVAFEQGGRQQLEQENNPLWQGLGNLPKAEHDRMRELMKRRLEELSKQLENDGAIQFDMKRFLDRSQIEQLKQLAEDAPAPEEDGAMFNFNAQSSMTVMDEEGSVTIKVTNGHHEVIVKDKDGEILFEGPYETAKDKAAVPDDVRGRIDNIDFFKNMKNGFRFEVNPERDHLKDGLADEE